MIKGQEKTETEYRAIPIDSSSSLKEFSLDRRKYYKKYYLNEKIEEEDNKAATIGRLVETLLLENHEFDNRFSMSSLAKAPTGKMLDFCNALCNRALNNPENLEFKEMAKLAHIDSTFEWKLDVVLAKFIGTDNEIYFKEALEVRKRKLTIVTLQDIANAEKIVEELKNNEFTADIVNQESNDDGFLVQNQVQIEGFEIDGLKLKGMMDKIIIDHVNKTIQCYDLKCVWAVESFYEEYYLYRRAYIQAYLYKEACYKIREDLALDYYTVENPAFLVCDSINYYSPLLYTLNSDDMEDAYKGFEHKNKKYPGVKTIIENLNWAKENNRWNISKSNYENNGKLNIKWR